MKKIIFTSVSFISLLIISLSIFKVNAEAPILTKEQMLHRDLVVWSDKLGECESGGNSGAINKKDSDGLPKFGLHQYMPSTFISFAKKYDVYPNVNVDNVFTYMLDYEKTSHLTIEVMKKNPKEFSHWGRTCRNYAGNPPALGDYLQN